MLTQQDREALNLLERETQKVKNLVQDAANQCRTELADGGVKPRFDDAHAALDAAIYRYVLACRAS